MKVREIMSKKIETIHEDKTVVEAAQLMIKEHIGCLIILDPDDQLEGMITERDILKLVAAKKGVNTKVKSVMTKKLITIGPEAILEEAADLMMQYKIKKLPVVENGELVGIVTATDLITYEDKLVEKLSEIFLFTRKRPFMAG